MSKKKRKELRIATIWGLSQKLQTVFFLYQIRLCFLFQYFSLFVFSFCFVFFFFLFFDLPRCERAPEETTSSRRSKRSSIFLWYFLSFDHFDLIGCFAVFTWGNAIWFVLKFDFDYLDFGLAHNMKVSSHSNRVGQYTINWQDNKKEIKRQKCFSLTN